MESSWSNGKAQNQRSDTVWYLLLKHYGKLKIFSLNPELSLPYDNWKIKALTDHLVKISNVKSGWTLKFLYQ